MNNIKLISLITIIFVIFSFVQIFAISLEESIILAKENNKEINSEKNAIQASEWGEKNALTNFLPKVSFNSTMVRLDNETFESASEIMNIPVFDSTNTVIGSMPFSAAALSSGFYKTSFNNNITIRQPIFNGGKVIIGHQLSKLAKEQALFSLQNKENDITFQVASTYFNILKIQELIKLTEKSIESSKRQIVKVQDNIEVGFAKESDILMWQVKIQNEETSLFEIKNNLKVLLAVWQNLLGVDDKENFPSLIDVKNYNQEIQMFSNMNEAQIEEETKDFLSKTEEMNITLKTLKTVDKMLGKSLLMAKGSFLPSLNLQFTYEIESDDKFNFSGNDNWNLVAAFSLPIFSGGSNYTNLKKVKYENRKAKLASENVREKILIGAKKAFYDKITKAQTVENNKSALNYAKENQKLINNLYDQGMITNNELLDSEIMIFASEMNLIASYYNYLNSSYETKKYLSK